MRTDADGSSVYDHLQAIMLDALEHNSLDAAHKPERFAELSAMLAQQQFSYGPKNLATGEKATRDAGVTERAGANMALFAKAKPAVQTTVEKPNPHTTVTTTTVTPAVAPAVSSVVAENKFFQYCGYGLPEQEAFLLDQSITKLAMEKKLQDVKFVGKIFGTTGDYIVVSSKRYVAEGETVLEEVNTMPKPPRKKVEVDIQSEPAYKGCNRLSFWVAANASAGWSLLPDTTPQKINAARQFRKLFTGHLSAKVVAYPHFAGTEADYLRAQLSRIVSATTIAPTGALEGVTPEEEEEEEEEEGKEKKPKLAKYWPLTAANKEYAVEDEAGVAALLDTEQWVHAEGYIYETGRQTKVPEKPPVEGEEEEEEPEEEDEGEEKKEEEDVDLFRPLKQDKLFAVINIPKEPNPDEEEEEEPPAEEEGEEGEKEEEDEKDEEEPDDEDPTKKKILAWVARTTNMLYKKHGVCVARSLRWPGAVAYVAQGGKKWGCAYFGNGLKKTDNAFTPVAATPIQKEAPDMLEVMDATAANEKLVLRGEEPKEADSEDEKEEAEGEEEEEDA